jgi:hypothetical protein
MSCLEKFLFPFFFKFFEEQLHFLSFPKMASSSSQNNFDLNDVPDAQQEESVAKNPTVYHSYPSN